tara:strand:- start:3731 stop:3832 length:102 start_codon:yes stop_codon:yes gene_type:complete
MFNFEYKGNLYYKYKLKIEKMKKINNIRETNKI